MWMTGPARDQSELQIVTHSMKRQSREDVPDGSADGLLSKQSVRSCPEERLASREQGGHQRKS